MKTFLRPGFYQKLIIGLLLFTQLGLAIYLLVRLSTYSEQSQLASYIVLSSIFVLNVAISSYIISSKSPDSYRLAWLWVVNCIPLLGAITYIVFANKQTSKRKRKMVNRYIRPLEKEESESELSSLIFFFFWICFFCWNLVTSSSTWIFDSFI
mgnify:CR=1 FL=1